MNDSKASAVMAEVLRYLGERAGDNCDRETRHGVAAACLGYLIVRHIHDGMATRLQFDAALHDLIQAVQTCFVGLTIVLPPVMARAVLEGRGGFMAMLDVLLKDVSKRAAADTGVSSMVEKLGFSTERH